MDDPMIVHAVQALGNVRRLLSGSIRLEGPALQSANCETTQDKELLRIILDTDGDAFLSIPSSGAQNIE